MYRYLILLMIFFLSPTTATFAAFQSAIPPLPKDYSNVDIYLGTREVGEEIYTKYGHTIVRVVNRENNSDIGYNWGTFDFDEPGFVPKFLKGILVYRMSYNSWWQDVQISRYYKQTLWMEKLNFTSKQKEVLLKRIFWQAQPENIKFNYLFFYDNCSTRVRDFFDEALGGQIKARTSNVKIGRTYRDRVMEYNASAPFFAMGQDVILNNEPDHQMSQWDDMFIPIEMRKYFLDMPAFDDNGQEIPGSKLLTERETIAEYPRPTIPPVNGFMMIWLLTGVPAALGLLLALKTNFKKAGIRLIGFSNLILGSFWMALSLFMSLSWAFGGHTVLPHNANLWMMFPLDGAYAVIGAFLLCWGRFPTIEGRSFRLVQFLTYAHMAGVLVLGIGHLTQLIDQDVQRSLLWYGPLTILVFGASILPRWKKL